MLKNFIIFLFVSVLISFSYPSVFAANNVESEVSNGYFSFTMPDETKGTYIVDKIDNSILIVEKFSAESESGGFAFGFAIYKEPEDYADMDDCRKIGELTDKKGTLYDLVLIKPREIRYGDGKVIEENFTRLYDLAETIEIKGINGSKYVKNQGMKGADLYSEILKTYNKNSLQNAGYTYYDINSDGIDELIIGEITKGKSKGVVYDVYTMVNRKPASVLSRGVATENYFVCSDSFLCKEYYAGPKEQRFEIFFIETNSAKLNPQVKYMYNANKNKKAPWFMAYGSSDYWENISKNLYKQGKSSFNRYKNFDYIPLN